MATVDTSTLPKLPAIFPCGCSHLKVSAGECDVYDARGALRNRSLDCAHDDATDDLCSACGMIFVYCHGCSSEAGGVHHEPPVCK